MVKRLHMNFEEFLSYKNNKGIETEELLKKTIQIREESYRKIPDLFSSWTGTYGSFIFCGIEGFYILTYERDASEKGAHPIGKYCTKMEEPYEELVSQTKSTYELSLEWMQKIIEKEYQFNKGYLNKDEFEHHLRKEKIDNFVSLFSHNPDFYNYELIFFLNNGLGKILVELSDAIAVIPVNYIDIKNGYEQFDIDKITFVEKIDDSIKEELLFAKKEYELSIKWMNEVLKRNRLRRLFINNKKTSN